MSHISHRLTQNQRLCPPSSSAHPPMNASFHNPSTQSQISIISQKRTFDEYQTSNTSLPPTSTETASGLFDIPSIIAEITPEHDRAEIHRYYYNHFQMIHDVFSRQLRNSTALSTNKLSGTQREAHTLRVANQELREELECVKKRSSLLETKIKERDDRIAEREGMIKERDEEAARRYNQHEMEWARWAGEKQALHFKIDRLGAMIHAMEKDRNKCEESMKAREEIWNERTRQHEMERTKQAGEKRALHSKIDRLGAVIRAMEKDRDKREEGMNAREDTFNERIQELKEELTTTHSISMSYFWEAKELRMLAQSKDRKDIKDVPTPRIFSESPSPAPQIENDTVLIVPSPPSPSSSSSFLPISCSLTSEVSHDRDTESQDSSIQEISMFLQGSSGSPGRKPRDERDISQDYPIKTEEPSATITLNSGQLLPTTSNSSAVSYERQTPHKPTMDSQDVTQNVEGRPEPSFRAHPESAHDAQHPQSYPSSFVGTSTPKFYPISITPPRKVKRFHQHTVTPLRLENDEDSIYSLGNDGFAQDF